MGTSCAKFCLNSGKIRKLKSYIRARKRFLTVRFKFSSSSSSHAQTIPPFLSRWTPTYIHPFYPRQIFNIHFQSRSWLKKRKIQIESITFLLAIFIRSCFKYRKEHVGLFSNSNFFLFFLHHMYLIYFNKIR